MLDKIQRIAKIRTYSDARIMGWKDHTSIVPVAFWLKLNVTNRRDQRHVSHQVRQKSPGLWPKGVLDLGASF